MITKRRFLICLLVFAVGIINCMAAEQPITISVFTWQNVVAPPADNKILKLMKEKLGVTLEWDIGTANKDQKIGVMIAGGDYDDLLLIDSTKFIDAGACVPLDDLVEKYAPNIKRHYAGVWEKMKEKDGKVYCLPNWGVIENRFTATYYSGPAMFIQKAVLKEYGYPKIKTADEYFDLIKKYKAKYPTIDGKPTIGFSILTYDWHKFNLINPPQFLAGYPNDGNGVVDQKTFKYQVFLGLDIAKRWYKMLNDMNVAGLIDKESFVDNFDQYLAKLSNGQVLGIHDQVWQFQESQFALVTQNKILRTMASLPIVFDKTTTPHWRDRPLPNLQRGYGISVKAKDAVRIIKFLDAQLSEEWQKIYQWGIKGEDYSLDSKGVPFRTPEQRKQQDDVVWKLKNKADIWYGDAPKMEGAFSDNNACQIGDIPGEYQANLKPEDKELLKAYGVNSYAELMSVNPPENPIYYPAWQIATPDGSPAQLAWRKCEDAYLKYLPQVIMAKPADFDKIWTDYVGALQKANVKVYEDFMQAGIDERVKLWSPKKK
jgi:putative aldouronate transport system substrate-binding protein